MSTPTSNPWIRYVDLLAVIERSTGDAIKGGKSARRERDWFYWEGVKENCRVMGVNVADLAVSTPQPPSAAMVEVRTLGWVLDRIDMMIDDLSDPNEQIRADKLLGLKALRAELRDEQRELLGG
ncbi:hypothetical protein [Corynebacterium argentoratense]|uniref:hypothetical protein n=1 Tax=Corynebacterium argentoratense TaxID=42817 RepID=UPI001F369032|nr:hypothetical protein [Corynebacterium argentoratense]MCF1694292.1 hypothetical protein [Corynebacterium argentoratense]MCF1735863.1 hypothetical protein [Corynebacterium argentoratense]